MLSDPNMRIWPVTITIQPGETARPSPQLIGSDQVLPTSDIILMSLRITQVALQPDRTSSRSPQSNAADNIGCEAFVECTVSTAPTGELHPWTIAVVTSQSPVLVCNTRLDIDEGMSLHCRGTCAVQIVAEAATAHVGVDQRHSIAEKSSPIPTFDFGFFPDDDEDDEDEALDYVMDDTRDEDDNEEAIAANLRSIRRDHRRREGGGRIERDTMQAVQDFFAEQAQLQRPPPSSRRRRGGA